MAVLHKLIMLVVISTSLAYQFSGFLQLPYSSGAYLTWLEQLLKYQMAECWEPLESFTANFIQTTSVKMSSME